VLSAQALSDHVEIAQLLQRYAKALDEKDYALLDRVFTPDAITNYELGLQDIGNRTTYKVMRPLFEGVCSVCWFTSHLISPPFVELEGDTATAGTRVIATHGFERKTGEKGTWIVIGAYRDTFVRTPDGWRIRERHFKGQHTIGALPPADELVRFDRPR
jgi:3-phenylpropionate/cinnamic acid dioxygenase small subunit